MLKRVVILHRVPRQVSIEVTEKWSVVKAWDLTRKFCRGILSVAAAQGAFSWLLHVATIFV